MGQRPNRVEDSMYDEGFGDEESQQSQDIDDVLASGDVEIQQTREEIGQTLDAIQAKLQPDRLAEDAKDIAQETVDHLLEEGKTTAQEVTEIASVAAMEAVDYATKKIQELLPDLRQQAQEAANEAVNHAVTEAKTAVQEISEQTRAALRDATIGRIERMAHTTSEQSKYVGSSTVERIKRNPGPAALTALGISWLFMGGKGSGSQMQSSQSSSGSMGQTMGDMAGQVQDTAGSVTDQVQGGLDTAMDQVQQTAGQVAEQAQHMVGGAADQVQQSAGQVAGTVQQVPAKTRRMIESNPMPLGLVAIALGSAAALLLPETRKENQLMGEARDALVETAKTKGQEVAEKAQGVVEGMQTTVEGVEEVVGKVAK